MELYFCVLAGALVYILFSLNDVYHKPKFTWGIFVYQNWLPTVINIICGFILVWRKTELATILPLTGIWAVLLGLSGQVLFKKLNKAFNKSFDTYIGIHE